MHRIFAGCLALGAALLLVGCNPAGPKEVEIPAQVPKTPDSDDAAYQQYNDPEFSRYGPADSGE